MHWLQFASAKLDVELSPPPQPTIIGMASAAKTPRFSAQAIRVSLTPGKACTNRASGSRLRSSGDEQFLTCRYVPWWGPRVAASLSHRDVSSAYPPLRASQRVVHRAAVDPDSFFQQPACSLGSSPPRSDGSSRTSPSSRSASATSRRSRSMRGCNLSHTNAHSTSAATVSANCLTTSGMNPSVVPPRWSRRCRGNVRRAPGGGETGDGSTD